MSDILDARTRRWLDARLQFFRKKTRAPLRDPLPTFDLGGDLPNTEGVWIGVILTWGILGAEAAPFEIRLNGTKLNGTKLNGTKLNGTKLNGTKLNGTKATINGRSYEAVRLGHRLVLTREEDDGHPQKLNLLALDSELIGIWQDDERIGEVYLLRESSALCERKRFSELAELSAVMLIASTIALSCWYFLHAPVWIAVMLIVGALSYLVQNIESRRGFHVAAWDITFRAIGMGQLQAAAKATLGADVASLLD